MLGAMATPRHLTLRAGPWIGMATNTFDPVRLNKGALKKAENLVFADFIQGKGTATEARLRPGRHDWNTDNLYQRFYLAEMEGAEATWTNGAQSLTVSKTGYASRSITHVGAATTSMYRTFTAKDITQGGLSSGLTSHTLVFWMRSNTPGNITDATSHIKLTSDVGPGAPGAWTNTVLKTFSGLSSSPAAMTADTWTKFTTTLSSMTAGGTFDPAAITGLSVQLVTTGAAVLHVDEVYIESTSNPQTVGLGEFLKASTGERFLLSKAGDTVFIDKDESLANTKVVSGLQRNRASRFTKVYNQAFMTDGDQMYAIDGTTNAAGAYNYRLMGFPAPTVVGITATDVAGGGACTSGVHHVWINYVYGAGSIRYGQSSLSYIGTITITAPGDQYRFTGLPVPAEAEGVVAKRLWIGLADDAKDAPAYFGIELLNADTAEDINISDDTLSAPTNPIGPRDNGVPTAAEYLVPFEGSLVGLRLSGNPTAYGWSRRGSDLNSGSEIWPAGNLGISQRGEQWTGAIVRGRVMYMFTKRSLHEAKFDQFGILNVSEVDQVSSGASHPVGALDMNSIWADDEGNVWFWSEQGGCVILPSGKVRLVFKERLYDEYLNINTRDAVNAFDFRATSSQTDWQMGTLGNNLSATNNPGVLSYTYPNSTTNFSAILSHGGAGSFSAGMPWNAQPAANASDTSDPPAGPNSINSQRIRAGATLYVLCKATSPMRITGFQCYARKGSGSDQNMSFGVHKYVYEFGRKASFLTTETAMVGALVAGATSNVAVGSVDSAHIFSGTLSSFVHVPAGEWFWVSFTNPTASDLKVGLCAAPPTTPGISFSSFLSGNIVTSGTINLDTSTNYAWQIAVGYDLLANTNQGTIAITGPTTSLQRYGFYTGNGPTILGAAEKISVSLETSTDGLTWTEAQEVMHVGYQGVGVTPANSANPFYYFPDYRPSATNPAYPHIIQRDNARFTFSTELLSQYGSDVTREADSKITTTFAGTFLGTLTPRMTFTNESSFTEPYANDLWTSPVFDMNVTPAEWGRVVVALTETQQKITMQMRTDSVSPLTTAWADITPNTVPTAAELPLNGRYAQVRFLFTDDQTVVSGLTSFIDSFHFSWRTTAQNAFAPMVPPCAAFFDRHHILAYAPKSSRQNSRAWCLSPGIKISEWSNQSINCFCIYDGRLLAGRANYAKVSQLFDGDFQDDGAGYISGYLETMPSDMDYPNVKTVMGGYVFTGCKEFKGPPFVDADIVPTGLPSSPLDFFQVWVYSGSRDNIGPLTSVIPRNAAAGALANVFQDYYRCRSHSTAYTVGVLAGDSFEFGADRQDAVFALAWRANTHTIKDNATVGTPAVKRFPYITDIQLMAYLETYHGVQQ